MSSSEEDVAGDDGDNNDKDDLTDREDNDSENSEGFKLVNFDGTVLNTRFKYGLVKEVDDVPPPSMSAPVCDDSLDSSKTSAKSLNISRIQITLAGNAVAGADDGTSVSNSSVASSSKNIDGIDQLIGHIEAHRPLLEEEDDEEVTAATATVQPEVKPFIEMDKEVVAPPPEAFTASAAPPPPYLFEPGQVGGGNHSLTDHSLPPDFSYSSYSSSHPPPPHQPTFQPHPDESYHSSGSGDPLHHSDFDTLSLQPIPSDESEENRRLDEEVERSLTSQVLYDQMNNKDLFGSIPFTDKELIVSGRFA